MENQKFLVPPVAITEEGKIHFDPEHSYSVEDMNKVNDLVSTVLNVDPIVDKVLNTIAENTTQTLAALQNEVAETSTPEEFFAEDSLPLAETAAPIDIYKYTGANRIKVDGDRTQLTEAQMTGVVEEVLAQTLTEAVTGPISFDWTQSQLNNLQDRVRELEAVNTKIIAALKHLGLDTNKHFR